MIKAPANRLAGAAKRLFTPLFRVLPGRIQGRVDYHCHQIPEAWLEIVWRIEDIPSLIQTKLAPPSVKHIIAHFVLCINLDYLLEEIL